MVNTLFAALLDELRAEGVPDPCAQSFTLAAIWEDVARLNGEVPPPLVSSALAGTVEPWQFFDADTAPALAARFGRDA